MTPELMAKADMSTVYLLVGSIFIMNIGAFGGGFVFLIKMTWNVATHKANYDKELEKIKKDLDAAHQAIRKNTD